MPASGSTLSVGSCGRGACTKGLPYSFVLQFDASIRKPVFRVALTRSDGKECLHAHQIDLWSVTAGEAHTFSGDTLLFSTTPSLSPDVSDNNCKAPFTTTTIRTEFHDSDIAGPVLLAQDFPVTYQWMP